MSWFVSEAVLYALESHNWKLHSPVVHKSILCFLLRGGAELLFDGVKNHHVTLPSQSEPWNMKQLLLWIKGNLLKERPELFIQGDTV
ncbi:URM1 protein, partial [Atractosteus spatula]|nr:URM1 protein [Atractosteus spatula]